MQRTVKDEMTEARAAFRSGEIGRARTCARRAVGMALRIKYGSGNYADTFIDALRRMALDESFSTDVRAAAKRLSGRSREDRTSPSRDPVNDASIILKHLQVTS